MKIIIIEGICNTGKTTLINGIKKSFKNPAVIKTSEPEGKTLEEKAINQDAYFKSLVNDISKYSKNDAVIFDRSWYGEYAYGTLYRHRSKIIVEKMIESIENRLFFKNLFGKTILDMYFILLSPNDIDVISKNEKSLSRGNKELILKENELFNEIFNKSKINKTKIYIDSNGKLKQKSEILKEALSFINSDF